MSKKVFILVGGALLVVALISGGLLLTNKKTTPKAKSEAPVRTYVAMGDSVAAGLGLATYSDESACNRTNQAYPNFVARAHNLRLISLACSGATMAKGVLGPQDVNDLSVKPQIEQLFALPKPALITITVGANDIEWLNLLARCVSGNCGTEADTTMVNDRLNQLSNDVHSMLSQIGDHYGSATPQVVLGGYYQILPPDLASNCNEMTGFSHTELLWEQSQLANLNITLATATANFSFAKFTPVSFDGHELCTATPWIQNLSSPAPYHPTAVGQSTYAEAIR
ncbi:MAG: SGNH/GDSL hydrolase family protein [Candidatus Saccharibacteria bacterium]